jgi:hypothetical protein
MKEKHLLELMELKCKNKWITLILKASVKAKPLGILQLTQSLYTWLKTVSLFYLPRKAQASQDIVCSSNLDSPNQHQLRKLNLPSCLFQKDMPDIFILNLALKPATSVCLSSGMLKTPIPLT